ncbi:MAG: succinate dehydrogenase cytochrome b subunit [Bacteroides sp.]|nr:succinate dehydrogenase cytochrome b subunit [Bacteroides sp.]
MWLSNSSVGRKVVMSVSGLFLILFLTFHMAINLVAVFSTEAYNLVCMFLGARWYALAGSAVLALGFLVHIVYAFWLTLQNRRARGSERYAVTVKPKTVEWASQNMLVLGIIVLLGLGLHFSQFWYRMQFAEIIGSHDLGIFGPTNGVAYIEYYFSMTWNVVLYLIWLVALWLHLNHGFWSALQSIGWNNKLWIDRWRIIGNIYSTVVILGFALVIVVFYLRSLGIGA